MSHSHEPARRASGGPVAAAPAPGAAPDDGHLEDLRFDEGAPGSGPRGPAGGSPRAGGGERRGEEHPDEGAGRGAGAGRGGDGARRSAVRAARDAGGAGVRHRDDLPGTEPGAGPVGGGEHPAGGGADASGVRAVARHAGPGRGGAVAAPSPRHPAGRPGQGPEHRGPATGGDRAGAGGEGAGRRDGRADVEPGPGGHAGAVRSDRAAARAA